MDAAAELAGGSRGAVPAPAHTLARLRVARVPLRTLTAAFLVLTLVAFPKGGFKVADVPVTWGYLGLAIPFAAFMWHLGTGARLRLSHLRLAALAALLPFQFLAWSSLLVHGFTHAGYTVSLLVTFFFIPMVLLAAVGVHLDSMDLEPLLGWIRAAIRFVAAYGIVLFAYVMATGTFFEIPFVTSNIADVGELGDKYNDRGGIFKLTSTYNNGNLYGVSILILLPLFMQLERRRWARLLVKFSLILSLSRTVWVGLLLWEVIDRVYVRGLSVKRLLGLLAVGVGMGAGVFLALTLLLKLPLSFLFDRNLGGRLGMELLRDATVLPSVPFFVIPEIVYAGIVHDFGMSGLLFFLLAMAFPLLLHLTGAVPHAGSEWKRSIGASLGLYLLVCFMDGGIMLIPIAALYWFMASLLLTPHVPNLTGRAAPDGAAAPPGSRPGPAAGVP